MRSLPVLIILAACLLALRPAEAVAQSSAPVVSPGDVVRVTVFRKPELTGEMDVAPDGSLVHPLYRAVNVAGITEGEMEQRIRAFLTRYEAEPSFVIERMVRVTVSGEVRQPNVQLLKPSATVFEALTRAGGATERGSLQRVSLYHKGEIIPLDMRRPGGAGARVVESGDLIVVGRRPTALREYVVPMTSIVAAAAALINLLTR